MTKNRQRINLFKYIKKQGLLTLGRYYTYKKQYQVAEVFYGKALAEDTDRLPAAHFHTYAYVLYEAKQFNKALDYVNAAMASDKKDTTKSIILRGQIYIKLKKYPQAEYDFKDALEISDKNALAYYLLGIVFILEKKWHQAEEALQTAQTAGYDSPKFLHRLGQAHFHMHHFTEAATAYETAANQWSEHVKSPLSTADMYYLAGVANERSGDISSSDYFYKKTMESADKEDAEILGTGAFHEKFQQYDLAITAYQEKETAASLYRLGLLYEKFGDSVQASQVYENALSLNQTVAACHFRLGRCYEAMGQNKAAAACMEQAIARRNHVNMDWYVAFLEVLEKMQKTEKYQAAANEVTAMSAYVNSCYRQGKKLTRQARYQMFYQAMPLNEKTVLLESMSGTRVSGNPLAIFKEMLQDDRFKEYRFIWTVNDFKVVPETLKHYSNVIFVLRYTDAFYKYLTTAK